MNLRFERKTAGRMDERGVTLVELLTAVSISVMVLGVAVALVYGFYSTFHKTTGDFELKSEANRIMNAIVSGSANATEATMITDEILFRDDTASHQLNLNTITGRSQKELFYDTFLLSDHVTSLKITTQYMNGVELSSIPNVPPVPPISSNDPNPLIQLEITLQDGDQSHVFNVTIKLLRANKPTLPS